MSPLPFFELSDGLRELGLVLAVLVGFGFGFVLERSGFGRAQKLVGQFYGNDMTVLKVMFSGIVTAMLGTVVLSGLGVIDLRAVADFATSGTYLWPMIVGGLLLGVGFIVSGYCPGTSIVAASSGKVDGLVTAAGVVIGTLVYAEVQPLLGGFHTSGDLGHLYLYDWLGVHPAVVAVAVTALAIGMFLAGEWVERLVNRRAPEHAPVVAHRPRAFAFASLGVVAIIGLLTVFVPLSSASASRQVDPISADTLATRVLDEPWSVRVIDLRAREACAAQRVPGAECVPQAELGTLALGELAPTRDLILVGQGELAELPAEAQKYHGHVLALTGGFEAWKAYALEEVPAPGPQATQRERDRYQLRAGLRAAFTGVKQAPPPPAPTGAVAPKKKAGGGGCGG